MTFISYAKNFEDVMLWRALKHIDAGFYIDVGAAWPNEHSVTKYFYARGWCGIYIEPNLELNLQLCEHRPRDINLKVALGENEAILSMNFVESTGLSTLDDVIARKNEVAGWGFTRQLVGVSRLDSVWREHVPVGQSVHFLKIDVEGPEEAVLRGNDWTLYRPWIVLVEATLPMTQVESYECWQPILLDAGYRFVYADGLNRFYVAEEHAELERAFKYPPNVFDDYLLGSQQESMARAQQSEAKAQQSEARLNELLLSKSWRLTAPLRWFAGQVRRARQHGPRSRLKALSKKLLRRAQKRILHRPGLRLWLLNFSHRLGIYNYLKRLQKKVSTGFFASASVDAADLPPYARRIYGRLKFLSKHQAQGRN